MVWRLLKKLKIELPCDEVISCLDIYPKELKSRTQPRSQQPLSQQRYSECPSTDGWRHTKDALGPAVSSPDVYVEAPAPA